MHLRFDFDPAAGMSSLELLRAIRREVAVVPRPDYDRAPNAFSHIFSGVHAVGYYSYQWGEVLSADAYSLFEQEGVLSRNGRAVPGRGFGARRQPASARVVYRLPREAGPKSMRY